MIEVVKERIDKGDFAHAQALALAIIAEELVRLNEQLERMTEKTTLGGKPAVALVTIPTTI